MQESSPRTDLCDIFDFIDGTVQTLGNFKESSGDYYFRSKDVVGLLGGVYTFEVTTVAGPATVVDTFELTLSNPCSDIELTIDAPIADQTYTFF